VTGAAPNKVELHPAIYISFRSTGCQPSAPITSMARCRSEGLGLSFARLLT
jgi:hypothetical protein